ncbi:MAG: N-acetyltransferase [Gammaproteobacteria bacterium]|nr:N-acetyltransferase [Gammaproteobacteria bacterium]
MLQIREACPADYPSIADVHLDAFGAEGPTVAELALALLADESARPQLALVAEEDGKVIGSIIFSSVQVDGAKDVTASILAPLAVARGRQRRGVGRELIASGLDVLRRGGANLVFVLGDPRYYERHGFSAGHGVRAPYDLPYPEAWMAQALQGVELDRVSGRLRCARSLDRPELW